MDKKQPRNSNIELLRIFSMFFIVLAHCIGSVTNIETDTGIPFFTKVLFGSWSILGVYLYVIISAWFLCDKELSSKGFVKTLLKDIIYILGFAVVAFVLKVSALGFAPAAKFVASYFLDALFYPFHWFVFSYLIMYLLAPYMNKLLKELPAKNIKLFLLVVYFVYFMGSLSLNSDGRVLDVAGFCIVYITAGYIKKKNYVGGFKNLLYALIAICAVILSKVALHYIGDNSDLYYLKRTIEGTVAYTARQSAFLLFVAFEIFLLFISLPKKNSKVINFIASSTFGIYLFHETVFTDVVYTIGNSQITKRASVKDIVVKWFSDQGFIKGDYTFPVVIILITLLVFFFGFVVDYMVQKTLFAFCYKKLTAKDNKSLKLLDVYFDENK